MVLFIQPLSLSLLGGRLLPGVKMSEKGPSERRRLDGPFSNAREPAQAVRGTIGNNPRLF